MKCLGNTGGWKCNTCLDGFYGNPLSGECKREFCPTSILLVSTMCVFFLLQHAIVILTAPKAPFVTNRLANARANINMLVGPAQSAR